MKRFIFIIVATLFFVPLEAGYSPYLKEWTAGRHAPQMSAHEHFDQGCALFAEKEWKKALPHFLSITLHLEESDFYTDALYRTAVCYYFLSNFDLADKFFTTYLQAPGNLRNFEKALTFKYYIAEAYVSGYKPHLFKRRYLPTLWGNLERASQIYDEVIAALSDTEIAVRALYGKAYVLFRLREYNQSVETFKTLVHRYEKHELSEMSLLHISEVYLERAQLESQNPDLLALADLNVRNFRTRFPSSPKLSEAEANVVAMQNIFGASMLETARFYERKSKPKAAKIYLNELAAKYPQTEAALAHLQKEQQK